MNFNLIYESFFQILKGLGTSLEIIFLSLMLGLILSIFIVIMRLSKNMALNTFSRSFVFVIRGTP